MARGLARCLGYELPFNFKEPYLSRNPVEFWRRWHMTLSAWLRDYLYVSLGGNRRGNARTFLNLFATMLLGGLWHGAAWHFVLWGGLHGLWLSLHRRWRSTVDIEAPLTFRDMPRILLTFHAVCALWIFFRSAAAGDGVEVLRGLSGDYTVAWPLFDAGLVAVCALLHGAERAARTHVERLERAFERGFGPSVEAACVGAVFALALAFGGTGAEFIYFQF